MAEIKDVQMYYVESDIEKIQTKTNLYLQAYGPAGAFHLVREVVQNGIDECIDTDSPGNNIYITYDIATDTLSCEDNGRGFPEQDYPMDIFCTKIQSGSKFFRAQSGGTSGEFGLGITACNALSDYFSIESFRAVENYRHFIEFENGKKIKDEQNTRKSSDKAHGSIIKFKPSKQYLGAKTVIPYKEVITWIEKMTYLFPAGTEIKIRMDIFDGMKLKDTYKFKVRQFEDLLDTICSDKSYSPKCSFSGDTSVSEKVKILGKGNKMTEKTIKKNIHLDVAMRYTSEAITMYDSYCNYTNTTEGGVHQDAVESCYCRYIIDKARATQTDAQKEKYKLLWEDAKNGLNVVINLATGAQVGFVGNAKQKVGNAELTPYLNEIIKTNMDKFFNDNPRVLDEYIKIVKLNAKARVEMQKVKTATQKERMNSFKEHEMKNFISCNNRGKKFRELDINGSSNSNI